MPPTPPPRKQRVVNFVSPDIGDLIFYELRDGRLPKYKTPPAYGTAHPDSNLYPNHKLVFVVPAGADEDGWQKWYYARSRSAIAAKSSGSALFSGSVSLSDTITSQDDYNFEIQGDEVLIRTYIFPRADYLASSYASSIKLAAGTADTVFTTFKFREEDVLRTRDQIIDSYFIVIKRYFYKEDRLRAVAEAGTAQGETGNVTTREADRLAYAIQPGIILQRSSRLTDQELWDNTENRLALRAGVNNTSISQRVGYKETDTSELSQFEPVTADEPGFSKRVVTTDIHGDDAIWAANRKTRATDPANGSEMVSFLGGGIADVDIRLVADTALADSGFHVIGSQVSPMGGGDAIKTTKTIDAYPVLVEKRYDNQLDAIATITKTVIVPGSADDVASATCGNVTEIQPVDRWRSIKINTNIAAANREEIIPGVFNYRFPAVLKRAGFYWTYASAANSTNHAHDRDFALVFVVEEAFSAACKGRTRRIITCHPETVTENNSVVNFKPQSQTVCMLTAYGYNSPKTVWARAGVRTWQTPMSLHAAITLETPPPWTGTLTVDDSYRNDLTATSPTGLPAAGTLMTIGMDVRRLKLGYWEVLVREIYSPGSA
jgi:hypothetical protein